VVKVDVLKQKALKIADFIADQKASDIVVLDIGGLSSVSDYFVICSSDSTTGVRAIADNVIALCRRNKISVKYFQKDQTSRWMLIDFFDVMLHIFLDDARSFYNLEYLWKEAKKVKIKFN